MEKSNEIKLLNLTLHFNHTTVFCTDISIILLPKINVPIWKHVTCTENFTKNFFVLLSENGNEKFCLLKGYETTPSSVRLNHYVYSRVYFH